MRSGRRANLARNSGSLQAKFANSTGRQAVQARFSGALASSCGGRSSSVSEAATTTQREGSCQGHAFLNTLVNRILISQKASRTRGANPSASRTGDPRIHTGMIFCCPRKKDPVAINSPRHIRQACRAMRGAPVNPPWRMTLKSSAAARAEINAKMKKTMGDGAEALSGLLGSLSACAPNMSAVRVAPHANRAAPRSSRPMVPSLRLTVIQALATR